MTTGWVNACLWNAVAGGTGNFTPDSAVQGYLTPTGANADIGTTYRYRAQNAALTQWEIGSGVWNGTTLARTTIDRSTSSDAKVNFSSAPIVMLVATAEDFENVQSAGSSGDFQVSNGAGGFTAKTATQATALLNVFTSSLKGLVPASGGSATQYLSADGNFKENAFLSGSGSYLNRASVGNFSVAPPGGTFAPGDPLNASADTELSVIKINHQWKGNTFSGNISTLKYLCSLTNTHAVNACNFMVENNESVLTSDTVGPISQFIGTLNNLSSYTTNTISQFYGFEAQIWQHGTGAVDTMAALTGSPLADNATITRMMCLWAQGCEGLVNGGSVTTAAGVWCTGTFFRNGFTCTNCYGVHVDVQADANGACTNVVGVNIEDQGVTGTGHTYNLYSKGAATLNILEGWTQQGAGFKRVTSQFDKTSNTTLANITGLSVTVIAGRKYEFEAVLFTTSANTGGVKAAIAGTATATAIIYEGELTDANTVAGQTRATALATTVAAVTAVTAATITIKGLIVVNAAGTLTVQFAQNASDGTASSVLVGSYLLVRDLA